jgi:hypothetical protein
VQRVDIDMSQGDRLRVTESHDSDRRFQLNTQFIQVDQNTVIKCWNLDRQRYLLFRNDDT